MELAFYERCGTFKLGEHARALPDHRRICEGFIDERVKLSKIVSYPRRLLLRLGSCSFQLILGDSWLPQQPQYDHFVTIGAHIKVSDKRPQRDVITGDSDDLIHKLMLQPCGNTNYYPEDNQDHKSQSQNFEADCHSNCLLPFLILRASAKLAPVTIEVCLASELNVESSVLLVGGPASSNLEASTEHPCSNMRNQPNLGDAQGTCYHPRDSARVDWRCQPGVVAPHADRASCFWRRGRKGIGRGIARRSNWSRRSAGRGNQNSFLSDISR